LLGRHGFVFLLRGGHDEFNRLLTARAAKTVLGAHLNYGLHHRGWQAQPGYFARYIPNRSGWKRIDPWWTARWGFKEWTVALSRTIHSITLSQIFNR
jgi:hypothetical protein